MVLCLPPYIFYVIKQSQKSTLYIFKTWLFHISSRTYFNRSLHILLLASLPGNSFPQINTVPLIIFCLMFSSPSFYAALPTSGTYLHGSVCKSAQPAFDPSQFLRGRACNKLVNANRCKDSQALESGWAFHEQDIILNYSSNSSWAAQPWDFWKQAFLMGGEKTKQNETKQNQDMVSWLWIPIIVTEEQ